MKQVLIDENLSQALTRVLGESAVHVILLLEKADLVEIHSDRIEALKFGES